METALTIQPASGNVLNKFRGVWQGFYIVHKSPELFFFILLAYNENIPEFADQVTVQSLCNDKPIRRTLYNAIADLVGEGIGVDHIVVFVLW